MKKLSMIFVLLFIFASTMGTLMAANKVDNIQTECMLEAKVFDSEKSDSTENSKQDLSAHNFLYFFVKKTSNLNITAVLSHADLSFSPPLRPPRNIFLFIV